MRILVVGAGAVGGYFGGRLAAVGRDVTFLVRARRAEQLRRTGLQIVSPSGDLSLTPKVITTAEIDGAYDLVLLSVKAYSLDAAMEDFAAAVGPETMILPLLNGMRHLDLLAARFGSGAVLGGATRISADLDGEGRIVHLEKLQDLVFGELSAEVTPRIQAVAATLSGAGFDDVLSPDVLGFMWQKWVILASLASITCLFRGTIGEVVAVAGGTEISLAILDECTAIAAAEGFGIPPAFLEMARGYLTLKGSTMTASMFRDLQKGAPVEADQIIGDLIGKGRGHGVETPLLNAAYVHLSVYQARLKKS